MEQRYINVHQDLIDKCRKGERQAQFRIYKLYYKAMFNTALRILNDTAGAEDVMQESFLTAFQRLPSYSGEGSFGSWLKRIVVNNALDALRKVRESVSLEDFSIDLPDSSGDEEELLTRMRVAEVMEALRELPEDYRVIITLYLIEGYDHEEIACILGITNQLSRTRFSRARKRLLELLNQKKQKENFILN